jgi:alkanesulfonate monooxygenase SsuD/methylene tetrahydromethanopterin reductase-like flavin-dependent oxidoreductase (luciferase family)
MTFQHLGFIHLVPFEREAPAAGFRDAIELFQHADALGLDSGWLRTRHLQYGVPSPAVLFGALAQATERIRLGNAVIPVEYENPFRLAEDLATADVLSGGRLLPGLSVHPPRYSSDEVNDLVFDTGWREEDYGYGRIERLRSLLAGDRVRDLEGYAGFGGDIDSERVEPHSPGLAERLTYGGGSLKSARWAGEAGLGWLVSNISTSENGITDFSLAQRAQIDAYREAGGKRVTVARVIVPTDGATDEQVAKYRAYAEARNPRTEGIVGKNTLIAKDVLGSLDEILEFVANDPAIQAADDLLFELPFEMELADWRQMLTQLATVIGPALGWRASAQA